MSDRAWILSGLGVVAIVIFLAIVVGVTDEEGARSTLEGAGYSEVQITGYSFFACGDGDWYSTGFKAIGPGGSPVSGAVCSGLIVKNSTIRFR